MNRTGAYGREHVQALSRGLAVIRAFTATRPRMTLSEAAKEIGLSRAAARRFLLTLVDDGYAETDGKWFWLGPRVLDLGSAYLSSLWFSERVQGVLAEVARRTGESCSASVLDGDDIVYVARVSARHIMTVSLSVGSRLPALYTSMGRVILAPRPDDEIERRLRSERARPAGGGDVRAAIAAVRRQGWAIVDQELEPGLISVAAPLRNREGVVTAAINVSSHASRMTAEALRLEVLPILREAAGRIGFAP